MRIQERPTHPDFPSSAASAIEGVWEFELGPGESTIPHEHETGEEIDLILEGEGVVTVGSVTRSVSAGDVIFVPAGQRHELRNESSAPLRGITIEQRIEAPIPASASDDPSIEDLDDLLETIPEDLDVSTSLQSIIRIFDLAGYISERIDETLGLDNEVGFAALRDIEVRVMDAVVEIGSRYQLGVDYSGHRRF